MNTKKLLVSVFCFCLLGLCSCIRLNLDDLPDGPATGRLTLLTDWANRSQGIDIPDEYTARVSEYSAVLCGTVNEYPNPMEPGIYRLIIHNTADKIDNKGVKASVATAGNIVDPKPGWLFTYVGDVGITTGNCSHTAVMVQQVRQLNFDFTITGGNADALQSVTVSLSGVANGVDFNTNTHTGTGLSVTPTLTWENNKLKGSVRLIGLTGEPQMLTLGISYTTGKTQQIVADISSQLSNFNYNKHKIITLTSNMEITNRAGFEATINKWEAWEGNNGIAW